MYQIWRILYLDKLSKDHIYYNNNKLITLIRKFGAA